MKQTLLLFLFVLVFSSVNSQRLIALEHNGTTTFHRYLDSAIYYAANGDKIYLPGGNIQFTASVNNLIIDKSVHIYGTGYHPDSSGILSPTFINDTTSIVDGANGGSIEGVSFTTPFIEFQSPSNTAAVNNFTLRRCRMQCLYIGRTSNITAQCSNLLISECVIALNLYSILGFNTSIVEKCFIGSGGGYVHTIYMGGVSPNVLFRNNNIHGPAGNPYCIVGVNSVEFQNNIILTNGISAVNYNCTNAIFNNNAMSSFNNFGVYCSGCIFNNNLTGQLANLLYTNAVFGQYSYSSDYRLLPNSAGKNAGTDSTDIGMYGTSSPFKEGGIPVNPHIFYKNIGSQTDGNGNLQINVKVKALDN